MFLCVERGGFFFFFYPVRGEGDKQQGAGARDKDPPTEVGPIGEIFEPLATGPPGNRHGNSDGYYYKPEKITGQQQDNLRNTGPDDFADPDLFFPLIGDIDHQTKQTETTDKHGEAGCPEQERGSILFRCIKISDGFVEEGVI